MFALLAYWAFRHQEMGRVWYEGKSVMDREMKEITQRCSGWLGGSCCSRGCEPGVDTIASISAKVSTHCWRRGKLIQWQIMARKCWPSSRAGERGLLNVVWRAVLLCCPTPTTLSIHELLISLAWVPSGQWCPSLLWLSRCVVVLRHEQGALAAMHVMEERWADEREERDYHYGSSAQALGALWGQLHTLHDSWEGYDCLPVNVSFGGWVWGFAGRVVVGRLYRRSHYRSKRRPPFSQVSLTKNEPLTSNTTVDASTNWWKQNK